MKKQKKTSLFIDVEAEESDDWSTDFSEELNDMVDSKDAELLDEYKSDNRYGYKTEYKEPASDWTTFTEQLERKYKDLPDDESDYESQESCAVEEEQSQQALIPNISSPKLWLCRVRPGKEKNVIAQLYEKIFRKSEVVDDDFKGSLGVDTNTDSKGDPNGEPNNGASMKREIRIFSAIFKETLPGYIYVESFTQQAVIDAFEGIGNVNKVRISAVPLSEMTDVLQVKKSNLEHVQIGDYARIRRGKYKNDLCVVTAVDNTELVGVKIVPRLGGKQELFNPRDHRGV
ncbi:Transcription elongation factor SPT5, partial [Dictyocoela roeselum]